MYMNVADVISHEWKTKLSRPASLGAVLLFAIALLYGTVHGKLERDAHERVIEQHEADVAGNMRQWLDDARTLERVRSGAGRPPAWAASPMDATFASSLPPAPLADFAVGQSDFLPYVGAISLWEPDIRLFSRYEFEDPVALALGGFDISKAVVLLLPLVLIFLSYDVLAAERDANRLAYAVAQGASLRSLVWSRLAIRTMFALTVLLAVTLIALLIDRGAWSIRDRAPYFVLWMCAVILYSAFWTAVIAFVASRNRPGETSIASLTLAWGGLTLIIPASVIGITEAVYPTPSPAAYLAEAREVEIQTELDDEAERRYAMDHPDMLIDKASEAPDYFRMSFLAMSAVDRATRPTLAAFEKAAADRQDALSVLRYLSPAIIAHGLFNSAAGTSSERHRRYIAQARNFKASYAERAGPYVLSGRRLPLAEAESLPRFQFNDESAPALVSGNATAMLFLMLVAVGLVIGADRRVSRSSMLAESPPTLPAA